MQAREIIKRARLILSDTAALRWSDERLLYLLNAGLLDLTKTTVLFINTAYIKLLNNQPLYDLSEWAFKIIRVEYADAELPIKTHEEMDRKDSLWQLKRGDKLRAYLLDKQNEACLKVYPIPENTHVENIDFGGNYGIMTGVTYSDQQIEMVGSLGDLGEVEETGFIKVYFTRKQDPITDLSTVVDISTVAVEPLTHYIAGYALRDNQDTQNRTFGAEEIMLYAQQIDAYKIEKAKNFSQSAFIVPYNPQGV